MDPQAQALVSGEGVRLTLQPAGVGSRTVAAALDVLIMGVALIVLFLVDALVVSGADIAAIQAVVIVELVLVIAGYPIVCEWVSTGRTVGKLVFGLRVVRDDGGPIGFRQALVRGLAALVLEKPGLLFPLTTIAGLLTISSSAREKRIGDMMAGTVVLNERSAPQALAVPPSWVPVPLQAWVLSLDLHRLDDRLALSARQFVSRAYAMSPAAQATLGADITRRILAVTSPPPPPGAPTSAVLLSVLAERRRRTMPALAAAGSPVSGAHPPPSAPPVLPPPSPGPPPPYVPPPRPAAPPTGDSPFAPPG